MASNSTPRLTTFRFRVWMGNPDNPEEFIIHGVGRDVQKTEEFFADKGWGNTTSRPMTAAAVTTYFALRRAKRFTGSWEEFEESYLSVEPVESVQASPTEAAPVNASPQN